MRKSLLAVVILMIASLATGCVATRKFVRNEVQASSDELHARIDTTDSEVAEVRDGVDRVSGQLADLDARTAEGMNALRTDVGAVDEKAARAQTAADHASNEIVLLDEKFQNRNHYVVAQNHVVYFGFDSARLEPTYTAVLDEIAAYMNQNINALLVLEGRTDSTGNPEYNIRLGERRVEAVKRYLAVDRGVPVYRIHEISLGAARPIADNASREGREKNRAVTISILVPRTTSVTSSSSTKGSN